jgi:putative ABC transport system permease protein
MARQQLAAILSVLRIINLRAVRRHSVRALLAAISLGGGVAVVVAVMIEITSVRTAIDDVGYRIAGPAPLRIVGAATRGGIEPAVIDKARKVPGVAETVPVIRAATFVRDGDRETFVLALGIDCSARWILDPGVCQPGQQEPQVLATSTTMGKSLNPSAKLATDVTQLSMPTLQQVSQLNTINNGRVVVLPLSKAKAEFARSDRVDLVYLTLSKDANASEVRARLVDALGPGFSVLTQSDPARTFNVNDVLLPLLAIFALIAVGVAVILISQITRLSVEERRREIAVAAASGASPLSALTGFLAEAALLGAAGSVIGVLAGIVISRPVVASASELTELYVGVNVRVVVNPVILLVGLAAGVLLAVLAAMIPSVLASRTAIATELSGRATHEYTKSRSIWPKAVTLLGIGLAGVVVARLATISGGLQPWQAGAANVAVVAAIIGLLLAAAYLSAQVIALIRPRPDRVHGATLRIALTALRADGARTTAIAGAIAVPVAVAMMLSGFLIAIDRGAVDVARTKADGRLVATTTRYTDWALTDAKFAPHTVTTLAGLPGVDTVDRMAESEITLADGSLAYVGAQDRPTFPFAVLAGKSPEESIANNQLVIGGVLARQQRVRVGDTLILGSGAKAQKMVVGTIIATPELGGRRIHMPYRFAERIFGSQLAGMVLIKPKPGFTPEQVMAKVNSTSFNQQVKITDSDGFRVATAGGIARYLAPLNTLKYALLVIAFLSVSSTLLLVGMRRRRETALIQALGATRFKVYSITTIEAIVAGTAGAIFGAVLAIPIGEAVRGAGIVDVGIVSPFIFPFSQAITYAAFATTAAVFAAVIPAWKATHTAPSTALHDE